MRLRESSRHYLPDPFGRDRLELAGNDDLAHQLLRLARDLEAETRGEAGDAQHAQRIFDKRGRHMPQDSRTQVRLAAVRVDQRAILIARHRIDREVASRKIVGKRHLGRCEELETAIATSVFALGARERVFLAGIGMQEYGEVAADGLVSRRRQHLGRGADDDPIAVAVLASQKLIANRATYAVYPKRL